MERLWAPWRMRYVAGAEKSEGCIFCEKWRGDADAENLVLFRGEECFAILNLFPYNNGHLMVVPKRHVASLASCTPEELSDLMRVTRHAEIALAEAYAPQGINVGINLGRAAGAGIVDHLHVHLVPRWTGDTSFISVVGNTRVLPEELTQTAARLRPIFDRLAKEPV